LTLVPIGTIPDSSNKSKEADEIDKAAPRLPSTIEKVVEYIDNL
jgi:hypothetical protein